MGVTKADKLDVQTAQLRLGLRVLCVLDPAVLETHRVMGGTCRATLGTHMVGGDVGSQRWDRDQALHQARRRQT